VALSRPATFFTDNTALLTIDLKKHLIISNALGATETLTTEKGKAKGEIDMQKAPT
jgi:predicted transposase YbfD/YdcC